MIEHGAALAESTVRAFVREARAELTEAHLNQAVP